MLDVARNFPDADTVITLIERAAALKFNVLHLHLTDDQGWRIALEQHPELTAHGSSTSMRGAPAASSRATTCAASSRPRSACT